MMPVPAHVAVMEALREAGGNDALVEEMKLWLLKHDTAPALINKNFRLFSGNVDR